MAGVLAVVPAAGQGTRLGRGPKALVQVGREALLKHCVRGLRSAGVEHVVVAVGATEVAAASVLLGDLALVVPGGADRTASVGAALAAGTRAHPEADVVLVHDAARAFTPVEVFRRVVDAVRSGHPAVVPVLPLVDTIRGIAGDGRPGPVVDRSALRAVQTPQGFRVDVLVRAYAGPVSAATDDAGLVEASGVPVHFVPGDRQAFKVTTEADLAEADRLHAGRRPVTDELRVGQGVDVHAIGPGTACHLAGLFFPGVDGCVGHSDADVVAHALGNALLAAAGLGDLGAVFGTDDPRWAGASGVDLLAEIVRRVAAAGFVPVNASAALIATTPKLAPRRQEAETLLSAVVGAPVSLAGATSDGLGLTGRGEGRAATATALLRRA